VSITPPPRTTDQQQAAERDVALRIGTPEALRGWAQRYDVPLLGMDDDELLLTSIHEARVELFPALRKASQEWLKTNKARILAARAAAEPKERHVTDAMLSNYNKTIDAK